MRNYLKLQQQFIRRQDEFEESREIFLAWTGDGTSDDPRVEDDPNHIYVRNLERGVFPAVLNLQMAPRAELPVWVGVTPQDDDVFEILGLASEYLDTLGNQSYVAYHHHAHQFRDPDGGDDVVWHQKQQGVYLLGAPTDPASMRIYAHRDFYLFQDQFKWWGGGFTPDLSPYMPSGSYGRYILVTVDGEINQLDIKVGTQFPIFPPPNPENVIPTLDMYHVPVTAVFLVGGMTAITWDHLFDVRLLAGGGYGAWEAIGLGDHHEFMMMNVAGGALDWRPFEWLYANQAVGANMVHTHGSDAQGGNDLGYVDVLQSTEHVQIVDGGGIINGWGNYQVVNTDGVPRNLHTITAIIGVYTYLFGHNALSPANFITVQHGVGNLELHEDVDFVLDGPNCGLLLFYREDTGKWVEFGRSEEVLGSGSYPDHNSLPGLQGGTPPDEYYHLPSGTYAALIDPNAQLTALHTDGTPTFAGLISTADIDPSAASGQDLGDATHLWDLHTREVYFGGATGTSFIEVLDDEANALRVVDAGGTEYARIDTSNAQPETHLNAGGGDIDHIIEAVGVPHAFSLRGSDGHIGVGVAPSNHHLNVYDTTLDMVGSFYGTQSLHVKTAGANAPGDDYRGTQSYMELDQATAVADLCGGEFEGRLTLGTALTVRGIHSYAWITSGTTGDIRGMQGTTYVGGGVVTADVYGLYYYVDVEAAVVSIGNDVYGLRLFVDVDTVPAGTTYMVRLDELSNVDYCIYQNGVAPSYFGGNITAADVFVPDGGTFGIAGNELLTVNAAGTFAFSGIAGVTVEDNDYIGNSDATSRLHFNSAGAIDYAYFLGCNVGIGSSAPGNAHLRVADGGLTSTATFYGIRASHTKTGGAGGAGDDYYGLYASMRLNQATTIDNIHGAYTIGVLMQGTADVVWGYYGHAQVTGGTVNISVRGLQGTADINAGTIVGSVMGAYAIVDIEAAVTSIGGSVYGLYVSVDADTIPTGDVVMVYMVENSNVDFGIYQNGSAINRFGGVVNANAAGIRTITSADNVSSPPTDAEIDAAFGTPAAVGDGFIGLIDDNGAGTTIWLCVALNSQWWYEQLTAAV